MLAPLVVVRAGDDFAGAVDFTFSGSITASSILRRLALQRAAPTVRLDPALVPLETDARLRRSPDHRARRAAALGSRSPRPAETVIVTPSAYGNESRTSAAVL